MISWTLHKNLKSKIERLPRRSEWGFSNAVAESQFNPTVRQFFPSDIGEEESAPRRQRHSPSRKCRSTLWNKSRVDGRTREGRIKAGRSRKTTASRNR
jgi:hypothetical protein